MSSKKELPPLVDSKEIKLALSIVDGQALHQWRYMFDPDYKLDYVEFLDDMEITLEFLIEQELMLIPVEGLLGDYVDGQFIT